MLALTPVDLNSVAVIGASCGDIAVGLGATLVEIACDKPDLVVDALVLTGGETAHEKARLLTQCYPSQSRRLWFDDEAFVGLMRAEAFAVEKPVSDFGSDYSVNQRSSITIRRKNKGGQMLFSEIDRQLSCTFPQHFWTSAAMRREMATQYRRDRSSEVHAH